MNRLILSIIIALGSLGLGGQDYHRGFGQRLLVTGIDPSDMVVDHHGRVWIVEKRGEVTLYEEGELHEDPVISLDVDNINERGLLSIALHPDFDNHPYLYIYYSVKNQNHNRLSRVMVNGDLAVPGSEEILIEFDQLQGGVHNGGGMVFDNDGYLYLGTGDGANPNKSQSLDNLLGKVIRIKDDGTIPDDNPFAGNLDGRLGAIWSIGLRNPFNLTIDNLKNEIWSSDVGAGAYEEINQILPGKNYGWPLVEGPNIDGVEVEDYQDPAFYYDHDSGCAITGLHYYNPEATIFPDTLSRGMLYADYCEGFIKIISPHIGGSDILLAENMPRPIIIQHDVLSGKLYLLTRAGIGGGSEEDNTSTSDGALMEISYFGEGKPRIGTHPLSQIISKGDTAFVSVQAYGSEPVTYHWYLNDMATGGEGPELYLPDLNEDTLGHKVFCVAQNAFGSDTSTTAAIKVLDNERPHCMIDVISGSKYAAGDTIAFSGVVKDPEDGILDVAGYHWEMAFHHNQHQHPVLQQSGINMGHIVVPFVGETDTTVWYRITLSGKDRDGLGCSVSEDVGPELIEIKIDGPDGVQVNLDGKVRNIPVKFNSLKGLHRTLLIPQRQIVGDSLLLYFTGWENGDKRNVRLLENTTKDLLVEPTFEPGVLGNGSGWIAGYYNDPEFDFDGDPEIETINSEIDFNWGGDTPAEGIEENEFTVRWEGFLQPYTMEEYTFKTFTDDGVRLWVNDSLIIDDWANHPPKENMATYLFESLDLVPVRMEYFENNGGALATLSWSSALNPQEVIPARQVYPRRYGNIQGVVFLDQNTNGILEERDILLSGVTITLFNASDDLPYGQQVSDQTGRFKFLRVPPGSYYLSVIMNGILEDLYPSFGIDERGFSSEFAMGIDKNIDLQLIFEEQDTTDAISINDGNIVWYPNPVVDVLNIKLLEGMTCSGYIVMDMMGRCMKKELTISDHGFSINLAELPAGMYIVKLDMGTHLITKTIIKI